MEKGALETDMPQSLFHTRMCWVYPLTMDGFITAKKAVHNVFLLLDGEKTNREKHATPLSPG